MSGVVKQLFFTCSPLYCCACKTNARWWKKPPKIFVKNDCDFGFDDDDDDDDKYDGDDDTIWIRKVGGFGGAQEAGSQ